MNASTFTIVFILLILIILKYALLIESTARFHVTNALNWGQFSSTHHIHTGNVTKVFFHTKSQLFQFHSVFYHGKVALFFRTAALILLLRAALNQELRLLE